RARRAPADPTRGPCRPPPGRPGRSRCAPVAAPVWFRGTPALSARPRRTAGRAGRKSLRTARKSLALTRSFREPGSPLRAPGRCYSVDLLISGQGEEVNELVGNRHLLEQLDGLAQVLHRQAGRGPQLLLGVRQHLAA